MALFLLLIGGLYRVLTVTTNNVTYQKKCGFVKQFWLIYQKPLTV